MILEAAYSIAISVADMLFSGVSILNVPVDVLEPLFDIMKYGIWVLGSDLFLLCWTSILFWLLFKLSSGIILFVYRLIPII